MKNEREQTNERIECGGKYAVNYIDPICTATLNLSYYLLIYVL